ncbi:MAG TPA: hypothetical protein VFN77_10985 [Acetobacteraceae bacterium]|nr:hypothetical protein [Acetobacteraceae bacterium]
MTSFRKLLAAGVAAGILGAGSAHAATSSADSLPSYTGTVKHFTITPRGTIDGIILSNGQDVMFPPYLSTQIAYAVKLGDQVTIHGLKAASEPVVQGVSITDSATHRTVVDNGPGAGFGPGKHGGAMRRMMVSGKIDQMLYGPKGEPNGVLLDDGTALHMPPPDVRKLGKLLKPGSTVAAVGNGMSNALGSVVMVHEIGASFDHLTTIAPPRPPRGWGHGPMGGPMHGMMMHRMMMEHMMHGRMGGPGGPEGHRPPPPPPANQ